MCSVFGLPQRNGKEILKIIMANQEKFTILYARLSQEDARDGESNSIQNQRFMLEKYAADSGFTNSKFMFDAAVIIGLS